MFDFLNGENLLFNEHSKKLVFIVTEFLLLDKITVDIYYYYFITSSETCISGKGCSESVLTNC